MKSVLRSLFVISLLAVTSYSLGQPREVIHEATFDTDLGVWTGFSVTGDQVWEWADFGEPAGCAAMSGYDGEQFENEDWFISPMLDFSGYSNLSLNFDEAINYEDGAVEDNEEIYISTDYTGSGNPLENGTWTELTVTGRSGGGSWTFVSVDEVDLSAYAGEPTVFLAFKYSSTVDNASTWEVDNILVESGSTEPMIEVTSPNGGEAWAQGSTHEITWNSENFTDDVKIELTGSNPSVIAASTGNSGSFNWNIPADQPAANDYKVKISDAADGDPMDESDAVFSIIAPTEIIHEETFDNDLGTWSQYSVTGDQVWEWANFGDPPGCAKMSGYDGEPFDNEDWLISPALNLDNYENEALNFISACNYDGPDLELYYSTDYDGSSDPSTQGTWTDITDQAEWSGGSWEWIESGNVDLSAVEGSSVYLAFVYHSSPANDAKTWEIDNIYVEAGSSTPMIEVTSPNGGEMWEQGSTHDITWNSQNFTGDVKIELTGSNPSVIVASTGNTGSYTWEIPEDQTVADDYKVKVSDAADGDPMDHSNDVFSITEPANYVLQATFDADLGAWAQFSVTGDQVWEWADFGNPPGCATVSGYEGEQFENEDWFISPAMDLSGYTNLSLNFEEAINYEEGVIEDNEEVYISTDYTGSGNPNENGTWTELTVTGRSSGSSWDFVAVDEIDLSAYAGESSVYLAFRYSSTVDNAGTWEIDNVIIEEPSTEPMIEVTSPNGGETWAQGSTHDITWTSENFPGQVKIELTGSNAEVLVESMENTGTYTWEIPGDQTIADDYKVKVSDAADGDPMDESDATFSITAEITYVHQETFDEDLGAWTQYSVTGDQVWEWAEQYGDPPGCAKMSGYDGEPLENDDWLISPALNLDEYTNEILTFVSACNYDGPDLELYYSTDYDGSSDPSTQGTWTDITGEAEWSTGGFTWVESGNVSLSEIQGESVYLAFVYHSSPEDDAKTWEVDNIEITGVGDVGLEDEIANEVNIYSTNEQIIVNAPVNGDITVYNLMGQKITSANNFAEELTRINMEGYRGYYIVKWTNGKSLATKKVMVY